MAACLVVLSGCSSQTPTESIALKAEQVITVANSVLTRDESNARTAQYIAETTLTPSNVGASTFGRLYSRAVDGRIYAQPLYVENLTIGATTKNVVYVATAANNLYAFDADATSTSPDAGVIWQRSGSNRLGNPALSTHGAFGTNVTPYIGIVGTPVIDPAASPPTMYLVTMEEATGPSFFFRLRAIDIRTGSDVSGKPPLTIAAADFDASYEVQRAGLLLLNGRVYASFAGFDDRPPYHGFLLEYNTTSWTQTAVWNSSLAANTGGAGIWMSGNAPAVNGTDIFVATGNGQIYTQDSAGPPPTYSWKNAATTYGDAFVGLHASGGLSTTPFAHVNQTNDACLAQIDLDLGSAGPMVLPSGQVLGGGKEGVFYLMNPSNLSVTTQFTSALNRYVSTQPTCATTGAWMLWPHFHGSRAYWSGNIYSWAEKDYLNQYSYNNTTKVLQTTPIHSTGSSTIHVLVADDGVMPSPQLTLSANGGTAGTGILWALQPKFNYAPDKAPFGKLRAFNAGNITDELWDSGEAFTRDALFGHPRTNPPTVAHGRVFVPTFNDELAVYGLNPPALPTTTFPPGAAITAIKRSSTHEDLFAVGTNGAVYHAYWDQSSGWHSFASISSTTLSNSSFVPGSRVSAVARDSSHVDLFLVDFSGAIRWGSWASPSGELTYSWGSPNTAVGQGGRSTASPGTFVSAAARTATHIDTFVTDFVGNIFANTWDSGTWSQSETFGPSGSAPVRSPVTAFARDSSHLDVWVVNHGDYTGSGDGLNGSVLRAWWSPSAPAWPGWTSTTDPLVTKIPIRSTITEVARTATHVDLATIGEDGSIQVTGGDVTDGPTGLGAFFALAPAGTAPVRAVITGVARSTTHLDYFVAAANGSIWNANWDSSTGWSTSTFQPSGTVAPSATIGVAAVDTSHLDVAWFDSSGNPWRMSYNGSWSAKTAL